MSTINALISKRKDNIKSIKSEVKKLNSKISRELLSTADDLANYYITNQKEAINYPLVFDSFKDKPHSLLTRFFLKLAGNRNLTIDDLSIEVLRVFEIDIEYKRPSALEPYLENTFNSLCLKDKLKIALYSNATGYKPFFLKDYLLESHGIHFEFIKQKNYMMTDSWNNKTNQISIKLVFTKNCDDNLTKLCNNITALIENGFKNDYLEIFEHTLSERYSYTLQIRDEEGKLDKPSIYEDDYLAFAGTGETFSEQLLSTLKYVSQRHYYEE